MISYFYKIKRSCDYGRFIVTCSLARNHNSFAFNKSIKLLTIIFHNFILLQKKSFQKIGDNLVVENSKIKKNRKRIKAPKMTHNEEYYSKQDKTPYKRF